MKNQEEIKSISMHEPEDDLYNLYQQLVKEKKKE
jgi:hypothetical protein